FSRILLLHGAVGGHDARGRVRDVPRQLYVVVGVLAAFFRVDSGFFPRDGDPETQPRDEVDEEEEDGAHGEAPEGGGTDAAELIA
ncbi:hypothetical protein E4U43_006196, partial [Claviceps pusilla]